jgi:hypothetical protein
MKYPQRLKNQEMGFNTAQSWFEVPGGIAISIFARMS